MKKVNDNRRSILKNIESNPNFKKFELIDFDDIRTTIKFAVKKMKIDTIFEMYGMVQAYSELPIKELDIRVEYFDFNVVTIRYELLPTYGLGA